jgi:hypothetical protein
MAFISSLGEGNGGELSQVPHPKKKGMPQKMGLEEPDDHSEELLHVQFLALGCRVRARESIPAG